MPSNLSLYWLKLSSKAKDIPWFWLGMLGLFLGSLALRLWQLSRFNTLVFDEVYFAKYGLNYITQTPFFDIHPPLGKYLIGLGIWLTYHSPFDFTVITRVDDLDIPTLSYRWMNALFGAGIPLAVAGIAYQLTYHRCYSLIAGLFTAADGLLLVESRYALINVYLVLFGLLGQFFLLRALGQRVQRQGIWLLLSGLCFGACLSVKWNGLGFLLGAYLLIASAWAIELLQRVRRSRPGGSLTEEQANATASPLAYLTRLSPRSILFNFAFIPALFYRLIWIPHLRQNPSQSLWEVHRQIWQYNTSMGSGTDVHPYCSTWHSWPWMIRPVGYFYQQLEPGAAGAIFSEGQTIYDVHAIGNPALWWMGAIAILGLAILLAIQMGPWLLAVATRNAAYRVSPAQQTRLWIGLYFLVNYAANFLPWSRVGRCLFIYHYMGASIFTFLAIAWLADEALRSRQRWAQAIGTGIIFLVVAGFVFWLPIYLGLPLTPASFQNRMWFRSWY